MSAMSTRDIETLIEQFSRAGWREMHLRVGGTELFLSTDQSARSAAAARPVARVTAPPRTAIAASSSSRDRSSPTGWFTVLAPGLGSFYRAPRPGAAAFADVGAHVTAGSVLCVIEVLKAFTPLRSAFDGILRSVHAQDGELVEFEQPLFAIEPHA